MTPAQITTYATQIAAARARNDIEAVAGIAEVAFGAVAEGFAEVVRERDDTRAENAMQVRIAVRDMTGQRDEAQKSFEAELAAVERVELLNATLRAEKAAAEKRAAGLTAALRDYGTHHGICALNESSPAWVMSSKCDCGLDAALADSAPVDVTLDVFAKLATAAISGLPCTTGCGLNGEGCDCEGREIRTALEATLCEVANRSAPVAEDHDFGPCLPCDGSGEGPCAACGGSGRNRSRPDGSVPAPSATVIPEVAARCTACGHPPAHVDVHASGDAQMPTYRCCGSGHCCWLGKRDGWTTRPLDPTPARMAESADMLAAKEVL